MTGVKGIMKIKLMIISLLAISTLSGCQEEKKIVSERTVPVPAFEIKIELEPRAEKELRKRNETIVISGSFSGRPTKESGIKDNDKAVGYSFGSFSKELTVIEKEQIVRFDNLKIPADIYEALEKNEYHIHIGVRSGWKSSKFNLLACDPPLPTAISHLSGRPQTLICKLIKDPNVKWTGISYLVSLEDMAKYTKGQDFDKFIRQIEPFVIEIFGDYSKPAVLLIKFNCNPNGQTVNIESQRAIPRELLRTLHRRLSKLPKLQTTGNVSFQTTYEITP